MIFKKIQSNIDELFIVFIFLALILIGIYAIFTPDELTKKAKSNQYDLVCFMKDGWEVIPKDKILYFDDNRLYWVFKNGYARNCVLEKK